jgi:hypothetical protein
MNPSSLPVDPPSPQDAGASDAYYMLVKAQLLRQREAWAEARALLEKAIVQWPQNEEAKELLLQTEKDQLAARRKHKSDDSGVGYWEDTRELLTIGLGGVLITGLTLFHIAHIIAFMVRHRSVAAPMAMRMRGGNFDDVDYVPAHFNLVLPVLFLCLGVWGIVHAIRSYLS